MLTETRRESFASFIFRILFVFYAFVMSSLTYEAKVLCKTSCDMWSSAAEYFGDMKIFPPAILFFHQEISIYGFGNQNEGPKKGQRRKNRPGFQWGRTMSKTQTLLFSLSVR